MNDRIVQKGTRTSTRVIVAGREDLDLVRRGVRRLTRPRLIVSLSLPIAEARRARLEWRINRDLAACGCNEGTIAGLLYLVVVPAFVMGRYIPHSIVNWSLALCGFIGSLVIGKSAGLLLARWRLGRTLGSIERLVRQT